MAQDFSQLLFIALKASQEAATVIEHYRAYPEDLDIKTKPDLSRVTSADYAANAILQHRLGATAIKVVSEENDINARKGERHWLIDPLDGTHIFIDSIQGKSNLDYYINVALMDERGAPVLGVVYLPQKNEALFTAEGMKSYHSKDIDKLLGGGVLNLDGVEVLQVREPARDLTTVFNMRGRKEDLFYDMIRDTLKPHLPIAERPEDMTPLMGMKKVLSGEVDVTIRTNESYQSGYPHDNAPWWLLLKNAGGTMIFMDQPNELSNHVAFSVPYDFGNKEKRMPAFIALERGLAHRTFG